jgi:hypothetical protein
MRKNHLVEIDAYEKTNTVDGEIFDLMEDFVTGPDKLEVLISRYARSASANVVRSLAQLLCWRAERPARPEIDPILKFISRITANNDPETLLYCTRALAVYMPKKNWDPKPAMVTTIFQFLLHCLSFPAPILDALPVRESALKLLGNIYEKGHLQKYVTEAQRTALRGKLATLAALGNRYIDEGLSRLGTFMSGVSFPQPQPRFTRKIGRQRAQPTPAPVKKEPPQEGGALKRPTLPWK